TAAYGIYATTTGADVNVAVLGLSTSTVGNSFGASLNATGATAGINYGAFIKATSGGTNYSIYTGGGSAAFNLGAAENVLIDGSTNANTNANGALYVNTASTATGTANSFSTYNSLASVANLAGTSTTNNYYGIYGITQKSGTDAYTTTGGTTNTFASYFTSSNTSGDTGDLGIKNTYGGYFSATGATAGATTAYGIYAEATGADNNYAGYFPSDTNDVAVILAADLSNDNEDDNPYIFLQQDGTGTGAILGLTSNTADFDSRGVAYTGARTNALLIGTATSNAELQLGTDNFVRLTISASGDIGIGDTTPDGKFDVTSSATSNTVAVVIDQDDTDQIALDINASNISANVLDITADSVTTASAAAISADALTTGTAVDITSTSTAGGASGSSYLLKLTRSGANANTAHNAYGLYSTVTNTNGTSGTNIAAYLSASNATGTITNYSIYGAAGNATFGFGASERFYIDGSSTNNDTNTSGVLDIDVVSNQDLHKGIALTYVSDSTATTTQYGHYNLFTNSQALGNVQPTYIGIYQELNKTGADTTADGNTIKAYGVYSLTTNSDNSVAASGTRIVAAGYFDAQGDDNGTSNAAYGVYAASSGSDIGYGIYASATGGSAARAGYFVGAVEITGGNLTLAGDVAVNGDDITSDGNLTVNATGYTRIGDTGTPGTASGDDDLYIEGDLEVDATANFDGTSTFNSDVDFSFAGTEDFNITTTSTGTAGVLDLNVTSLTHDNRGIDVSYTSTATGAATTVAQYGIYNSFSNTLAVTATSPTFDLYGQYNTVTKSGADNLTIDGTFNIIGIKSVALNNSTEAGATGVRNTYGGIFGATGAAGGTTKAYGIYAQGSGADTNWAGYFAGDLQTSANFYTGVNNTGAGGTDGSITLYSSGAGITDASITTDSTGALTIQGPAGDITIGAVGAASNIIFQDSSYIGTVTGETLSFGDGSAATDYKFNLTATDNVTIDGFTTASTQGGGLLYVNGGSTSGVGPSAIQIAFTSQSTLSLGTAYGISNVVTNGNSTNSNLLYGQYTVVTDSVSLGNTDFGYSVYGNITGDVAAQKDTYGFYGNITNTNTTTSQGTRNTYGGYLTVTGSTNGTANAYGIYATAASADNNYGIFSTVATAAGNYALYTTAGNIKNILGATDNVTIDGSTTAQTTTTNTGVLSILARLAEGGTGTAPSALKITSTGVDSDGPSFRQYGISNTFSTSTTLVDSADMHLYGIYSTTAKSGADAVNSTPTTNEVFGAFVTASDTSTGDNANNIRKTFGGYFTATGATAGDTRAYGVFATSTNADYGFGIYASAASAGTNNYGIFSTVTTNAANYALYTSAGNIKNVLGATDNVTIDGSTTANTNSIGTLYVNTASSSSSGTIGILSDYTSINTGTTIQGAIKGTMASSVTLVGTSTITSLSGIIVSATKSGADNYTSTGGETRVFGIYGTVLNNSTDSGAAGTRNTYGGYFTAQGATAGTTTSYGIYVSASASDNNYPIYSAVAFPTANTAGLCWDGSGATAVYDCSSAPGDLAENFGTQDTTIEAGDVVVASGEAYEATGPRDGSFSTKAFVQKSQQPYQLPLGVISTSPNLLFGDDDLFSPSENPKPVSLSGRVPVKVNGENGPISVGDLLATSSTPGVAMRADPAEGHTIGVALSSFPGPGQGKVIMLVETATRYNLAQSLQNVDISASSFSTTSGLTAIDNSGNITTAGTLSASAGNFTVDAFGNTATAGTLSVSGGQFTVDNSGNVNAQSLDLTGDATIGGNLVVGGQLSVNSIQAPSGQSLTLALSDSSGLSALKITDSVDSELLTLNSSGTLTLSAAGASLNITNGYLCVNNNGSCAIANPQNGTIYADAFDTGNTADLAEKFATTDDTVGPGDIVAVDINNRESLVKSTSPYQKTLLGIVSTAPGVTLNSQQINGQPLALAGRVPAKVSTENGPIKAGDPITSSSTPGVGMKATQAGRIIGIALEDFNPTSTNLGSIILFVEPGWYLGSALADNGSMSSEFTVDSSQSASVNCQLSTVNCSVNPDGTLSSEAMAPDERSTMNDEQIRNLIATEVQRQVGQLLASSQAQILGSQVAAPVPAPTDGTDSTGLTDSPTYLPTDPPGEASASAEATQSAACLPQADASGGCGQESTASAAIASGQTIIDQTNTTLDKLNALLSTTHLSLDTLSVSGNTQLAQTQVAGTFSQDGTFIIDYGRQLNVLGSALYLQNDSFAGDCSLSTDHCSLVDIGNGKFTFDKRGNLNVTGTLTAEKVETKSITIDASDPNAKTVGSSQLPANQRLVTIFTSALEPNAKILITPTTPTGGRQLYVSAKSDFEGFTVAIDSAAPTPAPITFDWLIVNTKQISSAQ
ncbi:TPA: hypothetical protein DIV55_06030, partial [Patescibacteria group bacterium]|nr:hypothetical protein [Patescibacteria group bacterium]